MKTMLLSLLLAVAVHAEQNLVPNPDFAGPDPLKSWRVAFPYQSQYAKNADYVRFATQLGRKCLEISLPPGIAGNQGGKIETGLIPATPGATYRAEIDCLTWDFSAKLHAEAYTTDPRTNSYQGVSLFIMPGTNGAPCKVMCWRAQFPSPAGGSKKWVTVSREFTLPAKCDVAGKECPPEFIVLKAVSYAATMNAGNHDVAITKFTEAANANPKCSDCYTNLGKSYIQKKDYDNAEKAFNKSNEIKPNEDSYTGLASVYTAQRKNDQAAAAMQKATALASAGGGGAAGGGGNATALYNQGVTLWNAGKIADAKKQFEAAVAANPNHAEAHYQLGMALVNEGNLAGAATEFNAYLKLSPTGPNAATATAMLSQLPK